MNGKPKGVIYDIGYRPYEGRYLSRSYALASLAWDDFKRALGVKKSWKYRAVIGILLMAELFIFFFFLLTSSLADIFAGPAAPQTLLNPYSGFYEFSAFVMLFLSALVAPHVLCDDRRYRVYPLYLARPISMDDYLLAKGGAIFGALALVLLGPALLLFLGKTFLARDALDYLGRHQRDLWALLASGIFIVLFYTSFSMGISSLTVSRGYATGAIIGVMFLSGLVSGLIAHVTQNAWVLLGDLGDSVLRVKDWLFFGELTPIELSRVVRDSDVVEIIRLEPLSPWIYLAVTLAVIALSWGIIWLLYRREFR